MKKRKMIYPVIKRVLDFLLALAAFIVLLPLFIIIICWIKMDSKGPVLFKQKRVGIHKSYFYICKFRTMRVDTPMDMPTHMLENPQKYITHAGKLLRKTSLDELPQIWNILKGDMSLVGPRPALWNQFELIEEREKYGANDILPGLTGLAQINGRDELEISEKARIDGEYVKEMSFLLDLKCIMGSIKAVVCHEGVREGKIDGK